MVCVVALVVVSCSSNNTAAPPAAGSGATGTTAPATTTTVAPVQATLTSEVEVSGAYRQGVARVPDGWVFSTNLALYRTTEDPADVTVKNEAAIPPDWTAKGYNHIGDIDVVDGIIYAPIEQPDYDRTVQAMFRYDATTLQFLDGVEIKQRENSFVTVDPSTLTAYSMMEFGGKAFTRYDIKAGWKPLEPMPMTMLVDKVQGADIADGALWLASDDDKKGLYRVIMASGQTDQIGTVGHLDGETEGIDSTRLPSGLLHVLSIDAKLLPVRLAHFAVSRG